MNIEKLGIKGIERDLATNIKPSKMWQYIVVDNKDLEELEQQRNDILEALIELIIDRVFSNYPFVEKNVIGIIEKATGKSWEDIIQLIGN